LFRLACPPPSFISPILCKQYEVDNFENAELVDYSKEASELIPIKGNFCFYSFLIDMLPPC